VGHYRDDAGVHGFLFSGGTYETIDYPSASETELVGINENGQIVGGYFDSSGVHSFLYNSNGGTYTDLNFPSPHAGPLGINDNGQIVGGAYDSSGEHGFLYNLNNGTYTTLGFS
jgi:probable HAF family extracellular repeat protein